MENDRPHHAAGYADVIRASINADKDVRAPSLPSTRRHLHIRHAAENDSLSSCDALGIYLRVEDGAWVGDHRREERGFTGI